MRWELSFSVKFLLPHDKFQKKNLGLVITLGAGLLLFYVFMCNLMKLMLWTAMQVISGNRWDALMHNGGLLELLLLQMNSMSCCLDLSHGLTFWSSPAMNINSQLEWTAVSSFEMKSDSALHTNAGRILKMTPLVNWQFWNFAILPTPLT